MRWRGRRQSSNIEDRRGGSGRRITGRRVARGGGISGVGIAIAVGVYFLFGGDLGNLLQQFGNVGGHGQSQQQQVPRVNDASLSDELAQFTSVVLADTEETWHQIFSQQMRARYKEPKLVLFNGEVHSGCGAAESAMGPFYCPADQRIYIDLSFYRDLRVQLGAPGDFAQAYVVAHEVGHHVQTLLGISTKVHQAKKRVSKTEANALQVRMELQADCFAGLWAHQAQRVRNIVEAGDIDEALNAAEAIGDDRLQRRSQGYVVPDAFTHGTSAQRKRWFQRGFQSGQIRDCDTFSTATL